MENNGISLARLYSGAHVVGKRKEGPDGDRIVLENPREIAVVPSPAGMGIAFQPVCLFGEKCRKEISLRADQVMVEVGEDELPKEIVNGYLSDVSGIAVASDIPDARGPGSFTL